MQGGWSEDGSKAPWVKSREPHSERKERGSQSPHSSSEAGNDRGAKEGRKVKSEEDQIRLHRLPLVLERAKRGKDSLGSHVTNVRFLPGSCWSWTPHMLEALVRGNEGRQMALSKCLPHLGGTDVPYLRHPLRPPSPGKDMMSPGNTNGIAGCGKSASPVWREGWRKPMRHPYPIREPRPPSRRFRHRGALTNGQTPGRGLQSTVAIHAQSVA